MNFYELDNLLGNCYKCYLTKSKSGIIGYSDRSKFPNYVRLCDNCKHLISNLITDLRCFYCSSDKFEKKYMIYFKDIPRLEFIICSDTCALKFIEINCDRCIKEKSGISLKTF